MARNDIVNVDGSINYSNIASISPDVTGINSSLADIPINVKLKYGAKGDNVFHTISSILPTVTLAQVQALNASATLSNSADWYALQLAINTEAFLKIPDGTYIIDLPLNINTKITIYGNQDKTIIQNNGTGHCLVITVYAIINDIITQGTTTSGSGIFIANGCVLNNVTNQTHGRYGIEFSTLTNVVSCFINKSTNSYNKLGGVYLKSTANSQKNNVSMSKLYCVKNGVDTDNLNSNATPTTGHGIYIDGGLGISLNDSVTEYNAGAGLYVTMSTAYATRGLNVNNMYYEQNKYAHLLVDASIGSWLNIFIKGSIYATVQAYPANSIQSKGNVIVYGYPENIDGFEIDDIYGKNSIKSDLLLNKQSLKLYGDFENNVAGIYSSLITKNDANAEGYNCLKLDNINNAFQEIEFYYTPVNNKKFYKITVECKYNKSTSTKIIFTFQPLDVNKVLISAGATGPGLWITTGGANFQTAEVTYSPTEMGGIVRYLRLYVYIDGTISIGDWVLIKSIHIDKLDGAIALNGITSTRPVTVIIGYMYFDTTLNKPVWWNGAVWKDATGTTV